VALKTSMVHGKERPGGAGGQPPFLPSQKPNP